VGPTAILITGDAHIMIFFEGAHIIFEGVKYHSFPFYSEHCNRLLIRTMAHFFCTTSTLWYEPRIKECHGGQSKIPCTIHCSKGLYHQPLAIDHWCGGR
jgi:hypothetical protein